MKAFRMIRKMPARTKTIMRWNIGSYHPKRKQNKNTMKNKTGFNSVNERIEIFFLFIIFFESLRLRWLRLKIQKNVSIGITLRQS